MQRTERIQVRVSPIEREMFNKVPGERDSDKFRYLLYNWDKNHKEARNGKERNRR